MKSAIVQHLCLRGRCRAGHLALALCIATVCSVQSASAEQAPTRHERAYENGDRYLGAMRDGMRHGQGRYEWAHGAVYEGAYQFDLPHGKGLYVWPNGDRYLGDWFEGTRHGVGRYIWDPGNYYQGEYQFGKRTGIGQRVRDGKVVYEGHFVAGVRQGEGYQSEESGDVFAGWYENGLRHGLGVRTRSDASLWLERWEEGKVLTTWRIERNPRCALVFAEMEWMFQGAGCIDALAHGEGVAVTLDGTRVAESVTAVLGHWMRGEVRHLYAASDDAQVEYQRP